MKLDLTEVAIELRCPRGWIMALWESGLLPSEQPDRFEIVSEALDRFLGAENSSVPPGTDLRRIYREKGAAERAGVAFMTLGMHRSMGWIHPIRPKYNLILYREIDIIRYVEYKKDRADMRRDAVDFKTKQKLRERAAKERKIKERLSGRAPPELALKVGRNGVYYIQGWADGGRVWINTKTIFQDEAAAALLQWRIDRTMPELPPPRYLIGKLKLYPDGGWRICWYEAGKMRNLNLKTKYRAAAKRAHEAWEKEHGWTGMLARQAAERAAEKARIAQGRVGAYPKMPAPAAPSLRAWSFPKVSPSPSS
ncbi:hypothetical protein [Methylobacterium sp. WL9]|uniref:hypothetical protein n=1 Tax=Methylobacterium sp. WL9 TaxID=2603898 RepID=UPI0011C72FB3|nr:hypothetical protein [Methylobacterium sp. WL9]TXN21276.1 hypothetical protein FV217_14870 [Methylobacterium sp. WL9]